jgi:hypothetical protein
MGEGKLPPPYAPRPSQRRRLPSQDERRLAGGGVDDLDVVESERPESYPQGLHHRLLGREPRCQTFGGIRSASARRLLSFGEQSTYDARRTPDHPPKAVDLDGVDADACQLCLQ